MDNHRFDNIWDAIEDTSDSAENMRLRSELMMALSEHMQRSKLNPSQAARLYGVTQPRITDLMRGKITLFSIDSLISMATAAGLHVEIHVRELQAA